MHPILIPLFPSKPPSRGATLPTPMFPYQRRITWVLKSRWLHLADALKQRPSIYNGQRGKQIRRRVRGLRIWNTVRAVAMVLLSASIIASIASFLIGAVSTVDEAEAAARGAVSIFRTISSSLAGFAALLYLFATRVLGQLEIDIIYLAGISRIKA